MVPDTQQGPVHGLDSLACTSLRQELVSFSPWHENIPNLPPVCCQQPQWAYQGYPICGSGCQCLEEVLRESLGQFGPSYPWHHPALLGNTADTRE